LKAAAMREFPAKQEGERREAGSRAASVSEATRDQILHCPQILAMD